jgi:hypothetical protein
MPGIPHEAVVEVLQNEPELVAVLLRTAGVRLPSGLAPVIADSNLSVRDPERPKQYTADNVFIFRNEAGRKAVVIVEVQSEPPDRSRTLAWPAYACVARHKHECDVSFLVFGLTREAVRGGGTVIHTGHRGFSLRPYTTGHGRLPAMTGGFAPELAVLHVVTHSVDMTTHEARMRVLEALAPAPADRRASYSRIVRAVVSETVREELEQLMKTVIKDPFIDGLIEEGLTRGMQQGKAQGKVEGEADAILRVLDARGLTITAAQRKRIADCTDLTQLQEWITRAATATTVAGIFA